MLHLKFIRYVKFALHSFCFISRSPTKKVAIRSRTALKKIPGAKTKSPGKCCSYLNNDVHSNIKESAAKMFKRRSIEKYVRKSSAARRLRLMQTMPDKTLNLTQSSLDSSIDGDGSVLIANVGCRSTSDGAELNSG